MIDSSSWTLPESESGGCQLGILGEFFRDRKENGHATIVKFGLGDMFTCKPLSLRNTIFYPHVFRVKKSNNDKIKVVCRIRFKDGRHINVKSGGLQSFHF